MKLYSPDFEYGEYIPSTFTCEGDRFLSPELVFEDIPAASQSLILIMEDPDVPVELREDKLFVHWVLFNIPATCTGLRQGKTQGILGANTRGDARYTGPCPPAEYIPNEHRYFFRLYALDSELDLQEGATKDEVLAASEGHIIDTAEYLGMYKKLHS